MHALLLVARCSLAARDFEAAFDTLAEAIDLIEARLISQPKYGPFLTDVAAAYPLIITTCLARANADPFRPSIWYSRAYLAIRSYVPGHVSLARLFAPLPRLRPVAGNGSSNSRTPCSTWRTN